MQPRLMIKGLNLLSQGQKPEKKNLDFPQQKKKKLLTVVLALECETGMLLSYCKGGLITENNVFVFSSAVLVTQCYVRTLAAAHAKGSRYLRLQGAVHFRYSRIVLERSQNVEQIKNWTGISPDTPWWCAGVRGDWEWCRTTRHGAFWFHSTALVLKVFVWSLK